MGDLWLSIYFIGVVLCGLLAVVIALVSWLCDPFHPGAVGGGEQEQGPSPDGDTHRAADGSVDLLPCPFCGESEELYPAHRGIGGGPYGIDCCGCGIDFVPREGADVAAAWNRRPAPASTVAAGEVERLRAAYRILSLIADGWEVIESTGSSGAITLQSPEGWDPAGDRENTPDEEIIFEFPQVRPAKAWSAAFLKQKADEEKR